jgi:uncharacterized SAM-binding protein YcdF (DUF218 family)
MSQHERPVSLRRLPRLGVAVLAFACAVAAATFGMWPRDDIPDEPDAIVVLGGVGIERAQLGIELSERYDAALVLSSSAGWFAWHLGVRCGEDALCIKPDPESTVGEARAVAALAAEHGWRHVTVVTSDFHTTRSRLLFRQCLGDAVSVVGARSLEGRGVGAYAREAVGVLAGQTVRRAC